MNALFMSVKSELQVVPVVQDGDAPGHLFSASSLPLPCPKLCKCAILLVE